MRLTKYQKAARQIVEATNAELARRNLPDRMRLGTTLEQWLADLIADRWGDHPSPRVVGGGGPRFPGFYCNAHPPERSDTVWSVRRPGLPPIEIHVARRVVCAYVDTQSYDGSRAVESGVHDDPPPEPIDPLDMVPGRLYRFKYSCLGESEVVLLAGRPVHVGGVPVLTVVQRASGTSSDYVGDQWRVKDDSDDDDPWTGEFYPYDGPPLVLAGEH